MENKDALIDRLSILGACSQSEITRGFLSDIIDLLKGNVDYTTEELEGTTAALEMMSNQCRHEEKVLRDTVEYLETLKGVIGNV